MGFRTARLSVIKGNQTDRQIPPTKRRLKRTALAAGLVYFSVYFWMTLHGRYVVAVWGSGGVKSYTWLPRGFGDYRFGHGDLTLNIVFAPVYYLEIFFWHTSERGFSGNFPREPAPRFIYPSK